MAFRDRIKTFRRVPAKDLRANPKNWRRHPEAQSAGLKAILSEIGFASAVIARETEDGSLELIDGHLRTDLSDEQKVPVLILDVTEEEAMTLLATFDPIGQFAEADRGRLKEVLESVETANEEVTSLIADIAKKHDIGVSEAVKAASDAAAADAGGEKDSGVCPKCGCPKVGEEH